jgi:hypothetical protein
MPRSYRRTLSIFTLVIIVGWASNVGAHRRGGLPLVHPDVPPAAQSQAPPRAPPDPCP